MERVLLQLTRKKDRRLVQDWLEDYQLIIPAAEHPLEEDFDLAIVDGPSLREHMGKVVSRRKAEEPVLLPVLLMTTRRTGSTPSKHLGSTVDDVILRPLHKRELCARVGNLLRMRRWSVALKKEHDRAMKLAITDDVSGFNNTRYLHRFLDRLLDDHAKPGEVSLVFFDLDNFKVLVDTHGHLHGSKALKEVAQTVARELNEDDRLIRYGGDEFIVVLPRQGYDQAMAKVSKMREAIENTPVLRKEGIDAHVTASFGVACFPQDAQNKHELLAAADRCLFASKTLGKNRVTSAEVQELQPPEPEQQLALLPELI